MAFQRDSLIVIFNRIISDIINRVTGADSLLRRSFLRIMARVDAGVFHNLYGFISFQALQLFTTTAGSDVLDIKADQFDMSRKDAVKAIGSGLVTGTAGISIPQGTELQSSDGVIYITNDQVDIEGGGSVTINFTALLAGAAGNDDAGILLSFVSPISSVDSTVTVDSDGIFDGSDIESDEDLRTRILIRQSQPPHGGAEQDYENWALEVAGVTRAWAFPEYQ
jgi:uncharacterized phage protein gp47/JayE